MAYNNGIGPETDSLLHPMILVVTNISIHTECLHVYYNLMSVVTVPQIANSVHVIFILCFPGILTVCVYLFWAHRQSRVTDLLERSINAADDQELCTPRDIH